MSATKILIHIGCVLIISSCCSPKTQTKPAAKNALPDRNIHDPKIDSLKKPIEKTTFDINK